MQSRNRSHSHPGAVHLAIAPALSYKIGDATTLTLEYEYLKLDRTYYDGLPPDPIVFKAPISRFLGEPGNHFSKETQYGSDKVFSSQTLDHKDAINRRLYNNQSFVLTAIYRVSCLNRTVLQRDTLCISERQSSLQ